MRVTGKSKYCTKYLEGTLKLKVNQKKSKIGSPLRVKFLGFSLHKVVGKIGIRPHGKVLERFKKQIREITRRNRGRSMADILLELKRYTVVLPVRRAHDHGAILTNPVYSMFNRPSTPLTTNKILA